jgi:hypothetical protein
VKRGKALRLLFPGCRIIPEVRSGRHGAHSPGAIQNQLNKRRRIMVATDNRPVPNNSNDCGSETPTGFEQLLARRQDAVLGFDETSLLGLDATNESANSNAPFAPVKATLGFLVSKPCSRNLFSFIEVA